MMGAMLERLLAKARRRRLEEKVRALVETLDRAGHRDFGTAVLEALVKWKRDQETKERKEASHALDARPGRAVPDRGGNPGAGEAAHAT